MLADNKPLMEKKLKELSALTPNQDYLGKHDSLFYNAAYNAYYEAVKPEEFTLTEDDQYGEMKKIYDSNLKEVEKKLDECAKKFAYIFCKQINDSKLWETLTDEIDKHIKSADIDINISVPPTVISPAGPCSGVLNISKKSGATIVIN